MKLKKQVSAPNVTLSLLDHKRVTALYQLFVVIDKRVSSSGSKEAKFKSKQKDKLAQKRAYLMILAVCLIAILLLIQLQHKPLYIALIKKNDTECILTHTFEPLVFSSLRVNHKNL